MNWSATFLGSLSLQQNLDFCLRILIALLCGGAIGFERSRHFKEAGIRTHVIVCVGAALIMVVSKYGFVDLALDGGAYYPGTRGADASRIAAQVVSGVGFLGAGAIIQMKGSVRGLTTAAGIWMTACLGLAVGAGMFVLAIVATLLIIIVLVNIERIERHINFQWESRVIRIKAHGIIDDLEPCRQIIRDYGVRVSDTLVHYDYDNQTTTANFMVRAKGTLNAPPLFSQLREAVDAVSITLTNEMNL